MSVNKVSSVGRVDPPSTATRNPDLAARAPDAAGGNEAASTSAQEPEQRRFPWLSWQTRELEAASKQPSPYGLVPLLGKTLDQKV